LLLFTALASTILISGASVGAQSPRFRSDILVRGAVYPGGIDDHYLTFSGPVSIPGVSLGAGTYIFRPVSPGVLQVLSSDRGQTYALMFTASALRDDAADKYEVWFGGSAGATSPPRILAWFRPNERAGQQFIYPAHSE
jgi:hypothetical protein